MSRQVTSTQRIIDNLRRVIQIVADYSKAVERSTGLTGPQLWALKILSSTSPLHVSDLARRMYLSPATVVGILDRLEIKGLVTRTRSIIDRRVVDLHLTEMGEVFAVKAPDVAQSMLMKGLDEMSDEQFAFVDEGMKQMVRILKAEHIVPQPLHG
ncbi:MAG: MarR family transcriptional regulator [Desulfuromonadaceae bacterium]|nr:MarR family transcriptional regulator [Desulfuromonadaceae bacterium]